jgi:uncharacterized protein (DUF433 family)
MQRAAPQPAAEFSPAFLQIFGEAQFCFCKLSEPRLYSADATKMAVLADYSRIITIDAERRSGKPCIRGLRITVYDVLDSLAGGMTHEEILADFPDLTETDIRACLAFANA